MMKKIISLFVLLSMLCSMAVFVLPANAAEEQAVYDAYAAVVEDAASGAEALDVLVKGGTATAGELKEAAAGVTLKALSYPEFPRYAHKAAYAAAGYDGKNWSITLAEDWAAMRDVADVATADYFAGVTFHLTKDVDFEYAKIDPMGITDTPAVGFAGTIDGHGYGFENLYVYNKTAHGDVIGTKTVVVTGLFFRLGACTIKDFGLNSGLIAQGSSNAYGCISSFGAVVVNKVPSFERVWSGAVIYAGCNAQPSALVGTVSFKTFDVDVNGFFFDGQLVKGVSSTHKYPYAFGIYGGYDVTADGNAFYNVISNPAVFNGKAAVTTDENTGVTGITITRGTNPNGPVNSALVSFSKESEFEEAIIKNVYGVQRTEEGIQKGYFLGTNTASGGASAASLLTDMSALETAYTINKNPTNGEGETPVYFTLKGDKIRPVAEATHKLLKVSLTGEVSGTYYANANTAMDLADLFGYKSELQKATFTSGAGARLEGETLYLGDGDVTLHIEITCRHDQGYTYTSNGSSHIETCVKGCGYKEEKLCSAQTYTIDAITDEQLAASDAATHSGVCQFCGQNFTQQCDVRYVSSAEANVDSYWDYSACVCGRENVTHKDSAAILGGDASGNGEIDLNDATSILSKAVGLAAELRLRNADVNGDNCITTRDALLVVRIWLGNEKAISLRDNMQQRANKENHYDAEKASVQALKMSGIAWNVEGYMVTEAIAIDQGNKLTFGPISPGQPVWGYFYDSENNPLQLINHTNGKVEYTFKEGMVMASISAPEGAKAVRLQLAENEKDQYYLRINSAFTIMDYYNRTETDAAAIVNPLKNKKVLTIGDSLCSAANEDKIDGLRGWARRIRDNFGANVTNCSQGGASISTVRWNETPEKPRQYILNQLLEHTGGPEFDYILLEGGVNDASEDIPYGEISDSFDPATFDVTTYAGGLEMFFYTAIRDHGDTAAIGYMSVYKMPDAGRYADAGPYFELGEKICEKWGIEYLDLFNDLEFDTKTLTDDNVHAITEGYELMQPHIDAFMKRMRPVPYEVYKEVMATIEIPEAKEDGGALYSAEENPYKDSLKILAIGNSFSQDATQYLWGIADSYGVENVVIGNMKIGGCSLDTTYEHITNNAAEYQYQKWATANGGEYAATSNTSIATALADEDWDIITLQQASDQNLVYENGKEVDTYTKVDEIIAYLQANEPDAKILWHMTWAYPKESTKDAFAAYGNNQLTMYNSLLNRAKELTGKHSALEGVLPVGTAIQNLRDSLLPLGITEISETGAGINRDGFHLNEGIGRYTAALTWYCYLTGADPRDMKYIPDNDFYTSIALYRDQITQSVVNAIQNPYNK